MKKKSIYSLLGLGILAAVTSASAAGVGAFTITLQDGGNSQTLVTLAANGFITVTGLPVSSGTPVNTIGAFAPVFTGCINDLGIYTDNYGLSDFGTFTNPNGVTDGGTSSAFLSGIQFVDNGGSSYTLSLNLSDGLGIASGDTVHYAPGSNSGLIDVPFSTFSPGTYNYTEPGGYSGGTAVFGPNINYTLDIVAAPEPCSVALAGLSGIALLVSLRRK
jgi:hypothetical protein